MIRHPLTAIVAGYVAFAVALSLAKEWRAAWDARRFRRFLASYERTADDPVAEIPPAQVLAAVDRAVGRYHA